MQTFKKSMAVIIFLGLICSPIVSSAEKQVELRYTSVYYDRHPTVVSTHLPWIEEVKKQSNGNFNIIFFNPNALVSIIEVFDQVKVGVADMGSTNPAYNPGKFPINDSLTLPRIVPRPTAEKGSVTIWKMYNKYPEWQKEFEGTKVLTQWVSAIHQIHTRNKPIRSLEDLKGMKMIAWSPSKMRILEALGANAIRVKPTDTYLALERGMADGVICPFAPLRSLKISEAVKYSTVANIGFDTFVMVMNKDVWGNLSDANKKVITDLTGAKLARSSGISLDKGAAEVKEWLKSKKHTIIELTDEEDERWGKTLSEQYEIYFQKMEKDGYSNIRKIAEDIKTISQE